MSGTSGTSGTSARARGLATCHVCSLVCRWIDEPPDEDTETRCPRCHAVLHLRKPGSLRRTSALLLAAAVLLVPANSLPVMVVEHLGRADPSTILGGIEYFFQTGEYVLGLIIFIASVAVPVLKIVCLGFLCLSVQRGWRWRPRDRTRLYRLVEFVGRWSMLDVFVVAILAALVRLGTLASIYPGRGAVAFGAVVVLTMLAAEAFDPRLIWDRMEDRT